MYYAIFFILILGPLVFFHELGHYMTARAFGSAIERFSVGFGPILFQRKDARGTDWALSLLPIGGYVKMSDTPVAGRVGRPYPTLTRWQRALVLLAGPAVNFVLALMLLAICLGTQGVPSTPPVVHTLTPGGVAAHAGLVVGDRIVSIGSVHIDAFPDIVRAMTLNLGSPTHMIYDHAGQIHDIVITPAHSIEHSADGRRLDRGLLGIGSLPSTQKPVSLLQLPGATMHLAITSLQMDLMGMWQMITGVRSTQGLQGVIGMAQISSHIGSNIIEMVYFAGVISLNLMLVNLLPVATVLDGGQIFLLAIEGALRHDLREKTKNGFAMVGVAMVLSLMLFTTFQDLWFLRPH